MADKKGEVEHADSMDEVKGMKEATAEQAFNLNLQAEIANNILKTRADIERLEFALSHEIEREAMMAGKTAPLKAKVFRGAWWVKAALLFALALSALTGCGAACAVTRSADGTVSVSCTLPEHKHDPATGNVK